MAQKTWAARHSAYPQTNRGLSNEGIRGPVITTWNQWQVWKTKTKAGCHRHIPQILKDAKQCQPLFGQGSGTDSGCIWRDSLGLQLRIPVPFPKGTCSSLRRGAPPLSENALGTPKSEPGHGRLLIAMVLSIQILPFPEAWPKPIATFHFKFSLRTRVSSVPVGSLSLRYCQHTVCCTAGTHEVREPTLILKRSKFSISWWLWPQ